MYINVNTHFSTAGFTCPIFTALYHNPGSCPGQNFNLLLQIFLKKDLENNLTRIANLE
jgi:hypothetical protein